MRRAAPRDSPPSEHAAGSGRNARRRAAPHHRRRRHREDSPLVYRVAHLIERGVKAERILLLTFTRRAAQEMLSRAERLVGRTSKRVQGGTFHATAHRLLRRYGQAAGLPKDFTIMDQGDSADLMQLSRAQLGSPRSQALSRRRRATDSRTSQVISIDDITRDGDPQSSTTSGLREDLRRLHPGSGPQYGRLRRPSCSGSSVEACRSVEEDLRTHDTFSRRVPGRTCCRRASTRMCTATATSRWGRRRAGISPFAANFRNIIDFPNIRWRRP